MEQDLLTAPNIDDGNFESISLYENDNLSTSSDEAPDSCCSSSVAERIELQQIPNSLSNALAMHAAPFTKNPNNTVAILALRSELRRNKTVNSNRVSNRCLMMKGNWLITIIVFVMVVALIATTTSILTLINKLKGEAAIQSTTTTSESSNATPSEPYTTTTLFEPYTTTTLFEPYTTTFEPSTVTAATTEIVQHKMIMRSTWGALPPREYTNLNLPVKRVIISHTVRPQCMNFDECCKEIRTMQLYEMAADPDPDADIAVNFLVGGDGSAFEGRGYRVGAHTRPYGGNRNSICIGFMGNFNEVVPPTAQLEAAKWIITEGIKEKKIHPEYKLYGHRQFYPTDSPGHLLYAIIRSWPHWSPVLVDIK